MLLTHIPSYDPASRGLSIQRCYLDDITKTRIILWQGPCIFLCLYTLHFQLRRESNISDCLLAAIQLENTQEIVFLIMSKQPDPIRNRPKMWVFFTGIVLSLAVLYISRPESERLANSQAVGIVQDEYNHGLQQCRSFDRSKKNPKPSDRIKNPRFKLGFVTPAKSVLISNATLLDGDGKMSLGVDIVLQDGLIKAVGNYDMKSFGGEVINANGHFVTPGIIVL
jgi:hypothetical protein